jgi:MraZ protein
MTVFLSSYVNTVDKKGRVSVPASFRGEMVNHSRQVVVVYAAPKEGYLYAWGYDDFVKFAERIKKLPPMSKERQRLARTILAAARPINFDGEGRVLLPENLMKEAGIEGKALFAGQGDYFTIWNPDRYEERQEEDLTHYDEDIEALSAGWDVE